MTHRQYRELYPLPGDTPVTIITEYQSDKWDIAGFWFERDGVRFMKTQSSGGDCSQRCDTFEESAAIWIKELNDTKAFWDEKLDWTHSIRIDGQHYTPGDNNGRNIPNHCKGYGGWKHTIRFFDGQILETDDLWHQGKIPPVMREWLPNNAEFIR